MRRIQGQIQFKNIYTGLAKDAELSAQSVLRNESAHFRFAHTSLTRDTRHLEFRGRRRDMWIES